MKHGLALLFIERAENVLLIDDSHWWIVMEDRNNAIKFEEDFIKRAVSWFVSAHRDTFVIPSGDEGLKQRLTQHLFGLFNLLRIHRSLRRDHVPDLFFLMGDADNELFNL